MELHLSVIMCKTESCWLKKFIWRKSIAYSRRHYIRNQRAYYRLLLEEIVTAAGFTTNILDLIYYTWTTHTQKIFTSLAVDKCSSFTNFTSLKDHAFFTWNEKVRITQFNANCWICGANATWIALKEQCFVKIGKYH